ncbi:MAG: response regulator [Sedimenticola sp.]|uniref:Response regulator n=1 Tax=Sedimenticola thiotaurini TaxID=1543721 RepID=A0A558CW67_9GAMM|nr:response regulator [Sedimenticola sp.]MCW8921573.1 response regulator [Sedimenticola sp.]MCW8947873.1 response regulator [Sedimenticola sp.]MCW8974254.1 response regulator [Sedimenticola sp.]TVT53014.1 MAG: response regulator [Sedimenticola thiotaurini]
MGEIVKILTIEDEAAVRRSLVAHLEDMEYDYIEASSGSEGIALFKESNPDLVLCDLRLPGMDGLDVLSTLTELSPDTPIIIVSGANQVADAIQALKRGAWDYITKPIVDFQTLDTAMERALNRARLIKENHAYQKHLEALNIELSAALGQLREDEEAARALQSSLLPPKEAQFGEYKFRRQLFPSLLLSGDFVDYFPIGDHEVGFYIADISGHGAASAFVTVMLKTLFEKHLDAYQRDQEDVIRQPSDMLDHLNRAIYVSPIEKYLTIFYGVLDLREHRLRFCSGGQFPYPMLFDGQEIKTLTSHDKPVGLFEDSIFMQHEIDFTSVQQMLMISDGILELFPRDSARRRTEWLLQMVADGSPEIDDLVERFNIEELDEIPDDIAFLSIVRGSDDE